MLQQALKVISLLFAEVFPWLSVCSYSIGTLMFSTQLMVSSVTVWEHPWYLIYMRHASDHHQFLKTGSLTVGTPGQLSG